MLLKVSIDSIFFYTFGVNIEGESTIPKYFKFNFSLGRPISYIEFGKFQNSNFWQLKIE